MDCSSFTNPACHLEIEAYLNLCYYLHFLFNLSSTSLKNELADDN
jgi:hypothetical protein